MRRTNRISVVAALVAAFAMLMANFAYASTVQVSTVDVTDPVNAVTLAPGASGPIAINMSVTGNQEGTATFKVYKEWVLSGSIWSGSNAQTFTVPARDSDDPATVFSTTGSVTIAAGHAAVVKTLSISAFDITNSNDKGAKLSDGADSTYTVTVTTPPPPPAANTAPVLTVPANMGPLEGNTLGGRNVTYTVTATDGEDSVVTPSCTPASGSLFPVGTTTVNCSVSDSQGLTDAESFTIQIVDTTRPTVTVPTNQTVEATSSDGAVVTYTSSASDVVSGTLTPSCAPTSGSPFALGTTTVTCGATDGAGNTKSESFTVSVVDTTDPVLTVPTSFTREATSAAGAVVTFNTSATDTVDANPAITCSPSSGSTFAIGTTAVSCTATDGAGNTSDAQGFDVTVSDTTDPTPTISIDGTAWTNSRDVTVDLSATDAVGVTGYRLAEAADGFAGAYTPIDPADDDFSVSDVSFQLSDSDNASKTVWVEFIDAAGNTATASDAIGLDRVNPVVLNEDGDDADYTAPGWSNSSVTHDFTSSDALSGLASVDDEAFTLTLSDESASASDPTTDSHLVGDRAGNSTTRSFSAFIDLTKPTNSVTGVTDGATYTLGSSVPTPGCQTTDGLSGIATTATPSAVTNSTVGSKTVTCSGGTDNAGNQAEPASVTYSVVYSWTGFFQPIDNNGIFNKAKAGSVIPVKFSLSGNHGLGVISNIKSIKVACPSSTASVDPIETLADSNSSGLKYDAIADQYNYAWKTSTSLAGTCQRMVMTLNDGSLRTANFQFTK